MDDNQEQTEQNQQFEASMMEILKEVEQKAIVNTLLSLADTLEAMGEESMSYRQLLELAEDTRNVFNEREL